MAKIDKITEQKILAAAKVSDVFSDYGVELKRRGNNLWGLCPFHEDRHIGSFGINERKNLYKCFSCGAKGDAVKAVMELHNLKYTDALRYLAGMYNIYIDDTPAPKVKKREPRKPLPPTVLKTWSANILKPYMHNSESNNLLNWMLSLPMREEHKKNLKNAIELYCVGTSIQGYTQGWCIFPQIDTDMRVRDMKLMAYNPDGHRWKDEKGRGKVTWMRALVEKAGKFDPDTQHVEHCLFGLHLTKVFTKAEICLVESEKSAILCAAFTDPNERLWLATGGLQFFTADMLKPLMDTKRQIVLYPDIDGYEKWEDIANLIDYPRMSISKKPKQLHIKADGPKADIADIMVRTMRGITESPAELTARRLHVPDKVEVIQDLIDKLDLQIL